MTKNMAMAAAVVLTQTVLLVEDKLNRPNPSPSPEMSQIATPAGSPIEACETVRRHVSYKEDPNDHWQSARETFQKRTGDCEDFATGVREMCRHMGYDAQVVVLVDSRSGRSHAVAQGEYAGSNWVSSNGNFEWSRTPREAAELHARMLGTTPEAIQSFVVEPPNEFHPQSPALATAMPPRAMPSAASRSRENRDPSSRVSNLSEYDSYYRTPYSDVESLR